MAKQSLFERAFSRTAKLGQKAMKQVAKQAGSQEDPQLALFESLTEQDFQRLSNIYGSDNVADYIKTFTMKKRKGEANG